MKSSEMMSLDDLFKAHISPKVPEEDWDVEEPTKHLVESLMELMFRFKE